MATRAEQHVTYIVSPSFHNLESCPHALVSSHVNRGEQHWKVVGTTRRFLEAHSAGGGPMKAVDRGGKKRRAGRKVGSTFFFLFDSEVESVSLRRGSCLEREDGATLWPCHVSV